MRKLFLGLLLSCLSTVCLAQWGMGPGPGTPHSAGGGGTLSLVQGPNGANNITNCFGGTGCGAAFQTANVAGNTIVLCVVYAQNSGTGNSIASISDTRSNTWTISAASLGRNTTALTGSSEMGTQCAYVLNAGAGANTVTPTMTATTAALIFYLYEIHDSVGSPSHDQDASGTGSSNTAATGSITTVANGEFGISVVLANTGGTSSWFSALGSWSFDDNSGSGNLSRGLQHQVQTTAGALVGNATLSSTDPWTASLLTFKP